VRTAAAGAVGAKHLAPASVTTAGVIGAGLQADLQIRALKLVRDFEEVVVWARNAAKAAQYAERMTGELGCPVRVAESAEACMRTAQVVVTTTPARTSLIETDWLHPGLHITAMGSDSAEKNEIAPAALAAADRFVCDRRSQSETVGELRAAIASGAAPAAIDELGEICAGLKPGREDENAITICDLTGTGVQDTAIATHAHARAVALGMGSVIAS